MSALRSSQTVRVLIGPRNPHDFTSPNRTRFQVLGQLPAGSTVGDFVEAHNAASVAVPHRNLGSTFEARRYLRYMVGRGEVAIEGFSISRRAPRLPAVVLPMAGSTSEFTFGVEIEFYLPSGSSDSRLVEALGAAGIDAKIESLNHSVRTWWKLSTDGSLRNYATGRELVSPVLQGAEGLRQVEAVCRVLTSFGCKVSKRCGFHVHVGHSSHGNSPAYVARVLQIYGRNERMFDSIVAPSRRGSYAGDGFCNSVRLPSGPMTTVEDVCRSVGATGNRSAARYRKLNVDCWWSQKTVEFRHHHGTVDAEKACNWVQLCLHVCLLASGSLEVPHGRSSIDSILADLQVHAGLSQDLRSYFSNRAVRYSADNTARRAA